MSEVQFTEGMKVRVFRGPCKGIQGTVTRYFPDHFVGGEGKVAFRDYFGTDHSFGATWVEPVPAREQGKEIGIEEVHIGDEIKVKFTEQDRRTVYYGVVAKKEIHFGVVCLRTSEDLILFSGGWPMTPQVTLLKAVQEKHELDDAEVGDNFRVFFPSGGNALYTFLRKDRWVRETYRLDGGLENSATEPAKKAKEAFDKFKTKLTKAVK